MQLSFARCDGGRIRTDHRSQVEFRRGEPQKVSSDKTHTHVAIRVVHPPSQTVMLADISRSTVYNCSTHPRL